MIHKNLSAWITDSQGNQLEEYQTKDIDDETTECWIPSEEGNKFKIFWQPVRNFEPNLGLRCGIRLDGNGVSAGAISAKEIARGIPGEKDGMTVGHQLRRHYVFGRQELTDRDDLEVLNGTARPTELGTIRITLTWVRSTGKQKTRQFRNPKEPGPLNERVKKGHTTAAALGAPVLTHRRSSRGVVKVDAGLPRAVFIFRYGPKDWLKAKEIISDTLPGSTVRRRSSIEPKSERPSKRIKREPSPVLTDNTRSFDSSAVIDIDDLESEPDSDVVVLNDSSNEKTSHASAKLERPTERIKSEATTLA